MGLKDFFKDSSNEIYAENIELLEEYDLINPLGSPNKLFLKFLKSKNIKIKKDTISEDLIEEFENSIDSTNLRLLKIQKEKEIIFKNRKVWINVCTGDEWVGCDLCLNPDGIIIKFLNLKIPYGEITDIEISEGGWSKNRIILSTSDDKVVFEINESKAVPLKEIIEDNIDHQNFDEINQLLELHALYEDGKISETEFEVRKAVIYSDTLYCTNCGFKIDSDSVFCSKCGKKVIDL